MLLIPFFAMYFVKSVAYPDSTEYYFRLAVKLSSIKINLLIKNKIKYYWPFKIYLFSLVQYINFMIRMRNKRLINKLFKYKQKNIKDYIVISNWLFVGKKTSPLYTEPDRPIINK